MSTYLVYFHTEGLSSSGRVSRQSPPDISKLQCFHSRVQSVSRKFLSGIWRRRLLEGRGPVIQWRGVALPQTTNILSPSTTFGWRLIRRRERKRSTVCPALCTCVRVQRLPSSFAVAANKHGEWFKNCRWFSSVQQSCNARPDLCTSSLSQH